MYKPNNFLEKNILNKFYTLINIIPMVTLSKSLLNRVTTVGDPWLFLGRE